MTLLATLAAAHWLRTVGNFVAFFPASPALGWLWAVSSLVTLLPAVVALVRLGTVIPDVALGTQQLGNVRCRRKHQSKIQKETRMNN